MFQAPAPAEAPRPSRTRPALSPDAPAAPRRSGVKKAVGPERRSGVRPALADEETAKKPGRADELTVKKAGRDDDATVRRSGQRKAIAPESAVDRARRRREANESMGKMLLFHWQELSRRTRLIVSGTAGAVGLLALISVIAAIWPKGHVAKGPEPTELTTAAIKDSFGLGPKVTWERPDLKGFDFFFNTPTRAVAVLHFEAQGISPDEVSISVNGVLQGSVPPDTTNSDEREVEQVLASRDLKRNAKNTVVFDNTKNPPGEDTWQISGLWLEVIPIPELPREQLLASAREYASRGKLMLEQRDIGSANLFKAWKNYRFAWLTLEALDEKPELYQLVRYQLANIGRDLDQQCGKMMLAARKAYELHDRKRAKQVLEEVNAYFPTAEHRCHNLALERLNEFDL
jgi:hypothetical protein